MRWRRISQIAAGSGVRFALPGVVIELSLAREPFGQNTVIEVDWSFFSK
jgi:hypothetical protein